MSLLLLWASLQKIRSKQVEPTHKATWWQQLCQLDFSPGSDIIRTMKRASCRSPRKCPTASITTETQSEPPDLSLIAGAIGPSRNETSNNEAQPGVDHQAALDHKTLIPNTISYLQQVGLARVRIEILVLSDKWRHSGRHGEETCDESTDETDGEESDGDDYSAGAQESDGSPQAEPTTTTAGIDNTSQVQASPSANQSLAPCRSWSERADEGDGDGDDENNHPRKRPRRTPRGVDPTKGRFACPYQAYEPGRNCFKPSQRNPRGGCDSISRLKDHLARKHMPSYRCQRCWKHFNAKQKVFEHQRGECIQQEPPAYEIFMTLEQESEVDNCGGMQPEDTWWRFFQILIPDMDQEDVSQLKGRYFPYYVDMSLAIPSLNLSNISFDDTPTQFLGPTNGNETTPASLTSPPGTLAGFSNTTLTSQSFSVPIYGTTGPQLPLMPSIEGPGADVLSLSAAPQSTEFDSAVPGDTINMSSTPASSHTMAPSSTSDTSQMLRNYERLKMRASQADSENEELRETINSTREEVRNARALLDEVLGMDNLEGEVYERLSRAAEILIGVNGRLR